MLTFVRPLALVGGGLLSLGMNVFACGSAQAQESSFQALAEHLTAPKVGPYAGPTLVWPEEARPSSVERRLASVSLPLVVHARREVRAVQLDMTLEALERAYGWLEAHGFALPWPSAGPDGLAIDVYLQADLARGASAGIGAPRAFAGTELDAAEVFARLDEGLAPDELDRCALSALAAAGLRAQDPAEPAQAVEAAAAAVVWLAYGEIGCRFDVLRAQRAAELGPLGADAAQVDSAAWWLTQLLARHDPNARGLLPGLFSAARQRSDAAPSALHAEPSFWQALAGVLSDAGESLDDAAIELAAARVVLPGAAGTRSGLPHTATVPLSLDTTLAALPRRATQQATLRTYGSAYAMVDVRGAREGKQLRAWLRADRGPRWSLVAITFAADGRELGRLAAPPRTLPEAFVPVELDERTARVALVVTKLPRAASEPALADADAVAEDAHGFELTIDAK
jgi:hypothetical protein